MISLRHLSYAYPGGSQVLRDITFDVQSGELVVLAGANGSGKSTLLALLAGLFEPEQGSIETLGTADPDLALNRRARLMHQDADLQILGSTVGEDMLLGRAASDPEVERACRASLRDFGLEEYWDTPVQTLSWGNKRKLCLATALADRPELLLLDEPFSGLDYPGIREMRRYLKANREQGLTQIVTSHDLDPVADLADRVALLHQGALAAFGTPGEVLPAAEEHGVRPPCSWKNGQGLLPWE